MFDSTIVVNWSKRIMMRLLRKNRNYLGLEEKPKRPPHGAAAVVEAEPVSVGREKELSNRQCRALEIVEQ